MRDAEGVARDAVEKVAFDGFAGGVGDRMHQAFEAVPVLAEVGEQLLDLGVLGDVTGKTRVLSNSLANLARRSLKRSF
jgi:phage tail tape-measure protein